MLSFDSILLFHFYVHHAQFFVYNAWLVDRMGAIYLCDIDFFFSFLFLFIIERAEGGGGQGKGERERGKEGRQRKEGQNMKY